MQISADIRMQSMIHHNGTDVGHLNSWLSAQEAADRIRSTYNTNSNTVQSVGSTNYSPNYSSNYSTG